MYASILLREIRQLIARDDLSAALGQLRTLLENNPKLDEAIHQSGRFQYIRKQIRPGLVSYWYALIQSIVGREILFPQPALS